MRNIRKGIKFFVFRSTFLELSPISLAVLLFFFLFSWGGGGGGLMKNSTFDKKKKKIELDSVNSLVVRAITKKLLLADFRPGKSPGALRRDL